MKRGQKRNTSSAATTSITGVDVISDPWQRNTRWVGQTRRTADTGKTAWGGWCVYIGCKKQDLHCQNEKLTAAQITGRSNISRCVDWICLTMETGGKVHCEIHEYLHLHALSHPDQQVFWIKSHLECWFTASALSVLDGEVQAYLFHFLFSDWAAPSTFMTRPKFIIEVCCVTLLMKSPLKLASWEELCRLWFCHLGLFYDHLYHLPVEKIDKSFAGMYQKSSLNLYFADQMEWWLFGAIFKEHNINL